MMTYATFRTYTDYLNILSVGQGPELGTTVLKHAFAPVHAPAKPI